MFSWCICAEYRDLDGKRFRITDAVVGVNCPPMHPNCRCNAVSPRETDEEVQADIDRLLDGRSIEDIERELDRQIAEMNALPEPAEKASEPSQQENFSTLNSVQENSEKTVDNSENSSIIEAGKESKTADKDMLILSSMFVNPNEKLYRYADKIKPLENYSDIVCHGTPNSLLIKGFNGEEWEIPPKEVAERIHNSQEFCGKPIRLISCQTGADSNGIAQQIADILQVDVMAPTEIVNVNSLGEMFLSNNKYLAEMWDLGEDVVQTGEWKIFDPKKG